MSHLNLFFRDISQVYVQSNISLTKEFFIRSSVELGFEDDAILKIIKSLYEIFEIEIHWFNTYHKHHTEKLVMQQFTYDSCLLYICNKGFEIVELQIDDILIFENEIFANFENFHFHEIKLLAKDRDQFTFKHFLKFNDVYIKQKKNSFHLNQDRLCKNLRLVTPRSNDLTNAKGVMRKKMKFENQYVAQRAKGAYIATLNQFETTFDFSFAAQVINPKKKCKNAK